MRRVAAAPPPELREPTLHAGRAARGADRALRRDAGAPPAALVGPAGPAAVDRVLEEPHEPPPRAASLCAREAGRAVVVRAPQSLIRRFNPSSAPPCPPGAPTCRSPPR